MNQNGKFSSIKCQGNEKSFDICNHNRIQTWELTQEKCRKWTNLYISTATSSFYTTKIKHLMDFIIRCYSNLISVEHYTLTVTLFPSGNIVQEVKSSKCKHISTHIPAWFHVNIPIDVEVQYFQFSNRSFTQWCLLCTFGFVGIFGFGVFFFGTA